MRHIMKAIFDDRDNAQQALDALSGAGYASADAVLVVVPGVRKARKVCEDAPLWRERSGSSTPRFLSRLFDHNSAGPAMLASSPYSSATYILSLATYSESDAGRAASLFSGFIHAVYKDANPTASGGHTSYRRRAAPGALQYHARATKHRPTGGGGEASAAYRFGHRLHENDRYRNRAWCEANADLKVLWEAHEPEGPDWNSSEPAVRLGWDSMNMEGDDDGNERGHWNTSHVNSAADDRSGREPGPDTGVPRPGAAWKQGYSGEFPAWANFAAALRYGWDRIAVGIDMDEADFRLHHRSN